MPITEAERQERKNWVCSSDIAPMLGLDPKKNAYDIWLEKTGKVVDSDSNQAWLQAGNYFEAGVLDWAEEKLGPIERNVTAKAEQFRLLSHLDGRVIDNGEPVEGKTAGLFGPLVEQYGEDGSDELPDRIILQCHCHMITTERPVCHVPAFIGGRGFNMFEVKRDKVIADTILEKALDFWDCVESDTPPENIVPSTEFIKRIQRIPEKIVEIDPKLIDEWNDAKDKVKWAEAVLEDAKAAMLQALGDAEGGSFYMNGQAMLLTYFEQSQRRIDAERLRAEKPEIAKQYTKVTSFRVPRLKKIKRGFEIPQKLPKF